MRIIIEGCDKSGKSTLIEALKNKIPSMIGLKLLTKPKDGSEESQKYIKQMYMHMADMTRSQAAHYLFDRFYPSQMVYSFKRKHDDMEDPFYWGFEKELAKTPSLYILLDVREDLLAARFESEGETYALPEDIKKIKARYLDHYDKCQLNKYKVDPTDNLEATVEEILAIIKEILTVKTTDFSQPISR